MYAVYFRDRVLWNEALTNRHTSWGAPGRHASLLDSSVVRDDRGNRRKTLGGWSRGESLWSTYRVHEAARCLVIHPHPCPPSDFIIPSTSPWQTRSALYQRATGYLSYFSSFSYPAVLIPFVIYTASVLVSSRGQAVAARLGHGAHRPGKEEPPVPPVAAFRKPLNGFRHIC